MAVKQATFDSSNDLPNALKRVRKALGLTQEEFGVLSSRTYLSTLERGLKSPTLGKLEQICETMGIHPLTLLALAYAPGGDLQMLLAQVQAEATRIQHSEDRLRGRGGRQ